MQHFSQKESSERNKANEANDYDSALVGVRMSCNVNDSEHDLDELLQETT